MKAEWGMLVQVSTLVLRFIPFPAAVQPEGIGLLVFCVVVGLFTLFFR